MRPVTMDAPGGENGNDKGRHIGLPVRGGCGVGAHRCVRPVAMDAPGGDNGNDRGRHIGLPLRGGRGVGAHRCVRPSAIVHLEDGYA